MTDLHTNYLGLPLRSPIVASAGPLTGEVDRIRELETHGAAAVVLPSLFEEQIEHETNEIDRLLPLHGDSFGEATSFSPRTRRLQQRRRPVSRPRRGREGTPSTSR